MSPDEIESVQQALTLDYEFPYGEDGARFFEGLRDEKQIYGSRCPECENVMIPPEAFCSHCFTDTEEDLVEVDDVGSLNSWTEIRLPFPGQPTSPPYIWAFVEPDGADTILQHILDPELAKDEIEVGMRIRAVWRGDDERDGELNDIAYFEKVE